MRILYLSQLVPYPVDAGPKVRIYNVLRYLSSAGHDVTLVAFRRPDDRPEQIDKLKRFCDQVYTVLMPRSPLRDVKNLVQSLLNKRPFLIQRDHVSEMEKLLREVLAREAFDAIHADQLWMAPYALYARDLSERSHHAMTILDQHNAVHLVVQRLASTTGNPIRKRILNRESRLMAGYEIDSCRHFDHVVWVTDEDRRAVTQIANGSVAGLTGPTIAICVDPEEQLAFSQPTGRKRVTFIGGMHWPPNHDGILWFANEVWPLVRAQSPDAELTVIGKNPPEALIGFENNEGTTASTGGIFAPGYVEDPSPYLQETAVFIVPLWAGGGMRVKILDAWAWGLPIVSTTIGAEGLLYEDGQDLMIADDPELFANAVLHLLDHPETATRMRDAGRARVEKSYDWRTVYPAWDEIYGEPVN